MTTRKYRRFIKEFKLEAVRLAEESEQPITQVAQELGIRVNQLYKWKQQLNTKQDDAFPGKGKQLGKAAELTRLKRELARLKGNNQGQILASTYI